MKILWKQGTHQRNEIADSVKLSLFRHRLQRNSIFKLTQNEPNDKYFLHYDDVRGDVLRPPHGTTPAAVKIK